MVHSWVKGCYNVTFALNLSNFFTQLLLRRKSQIDIVIFLFDGHIYLQKRLILCFKKSNGL